MPRQKKPVIFSTHPLHERAAALLEGHGKLVVATAIDAVTLADEARDADIVIVRANLPPVLFERAKKLRAAIRHGAGLDMIPMEAATRAGVLVANVPGANARTVAEHVIWTSMALLRKFRQVDRDLRKIGWLAGREHAAEFARAFARAGFVVGSGLAAGIDAAAHAATLAVDGGTVAVLGTGPDVVYPRSNTELHRRIAEAGALVTEHLPGTGPRREHFPSRNRLLAALCLGTVVVEAAERSGAMITARLAADAGREVFALPGSIRNPLARGCHRLIRDGATLVQSPEDVIEQLGAAAAEEAAAHRRELDRPAPAADEWTASNDAAMPGSDHEVLWKVLGFDPTDMDQLIERTGLTPSRLSSMLLVMELEGRVAQQHGRFFRVA